MREFFGLRDHKNKWDIKLIIRKIWVAHKEIVQVKGESVEVTVYVGSNHSKEDAIEQARKKLPIIKSKIENQNPAIDDYVVEIREEIIKDLNEKNIVTRNHYGALVLNSEDTPFIDIDQPHRSFFSWIFFSDTNDRFKQTANI